MNDETTSLNALCAQIRACRICREAPSGPPLPHEPRPVFRVSETARILIAGQAPGTRVHASGMPFTDPSGVRLRAWLNMPDEVFYDVTRVAIVPMGFCFPGQDERGADLPPRPECAPAWRARLLAALPNVRLVLAVGQYAINWHVPKHLRRRTLTDTVRQWRAIARATAPMTIPLPHPSWRNNAWLKRNPWFEEEVLPFTRARIAELLGERTFSRQRKGNP